ncbi:unnamed protein product [Heligmosomoides polygyrus]|uniref:NAD(P)-binding Rossmann-fold superfamily protein n=1 Tax=Heligmosomoides polygyrus TaxID=6339 RepID=A0A183G251_HELPZ|nr:unnamed protein product [Heligmosomoides polygyrus]
MGRISAEISSRLSVEACKNHFMGTTCKGACEIAVSGALILELLKVESVVGEGGLNVLLNNAAILTPYFTSRAISREAFMNCINVNLLGTAIVSQTFLPLLLKASSHTADDHIGVDRAAIVNISATWGSIGRNADGSGPMGALAYKVSKLGKTMAIDLKGDKILVVQFCPGWVKTDLGGKAATDTVEVATSGLVKAMSSLGKEHSGGFFDRRLKAIPY